MTALLDTKLPDLKFGWWDPHTVPQTFFLIDRDMKPLEVSLSVNNVCASLSVSLSLIVHFYLHLHVYVTCKSVILRRV